MTDMLSVTDASDTDAILIVGGDGTISKVFFFIFFLSMYIRGFYLTVSLPVY